MNDLQLLKGDCLDLMPWLVSDESVDALVCDPPAGIGFMGKEWDRHKGGRKEWIEWMTEIMRECLRVMKPGAHGLVWALPRTSHWTATALEDAGFEVRDVVIHLFGSGFPKSLDVSKAIDKAAGAKGPIVGKNPAYRERQLEHDAKWKTAMRPEHKRGPATDAAKQWQGFGTALKPASEHWILVRKPCSEKTVAANVLKWGCGALNIDASRIGMREATSYTAPDITGNAYNSEVGARARKTVEAPAQGRFPANLVFTEGEAVEMLDAQSADAKGVGASRFFYVAKISQAERNAGLEGIDAKRAPLGDDRPSGGSMSRLDGRAKRMNQNTHPTVKPKKLMTYLIRMVTSPGGIVLDPFMGSGSTGVAARDAGFKFIGVEKEEEYFEIAKKRIGASK
jgi:hypothetical protein